VTRAVVAEAQVDASKAKAGFDTAGKAASGFGAKLTAIGNSKGFKSVAQGFGMGAGISAYGLLTSAIGGVVGILGDSVKAFMADEASRARLNTSLKANITVYNGTQDAIERVLSARMDLGFSDDEQRDSLAKIVVATHDYQKGLEVQAAAMDLARLKGVDLATATDALVKVEGGQFRLLKSMGIVLKDGATAQDALTAVQKAAEGQAIAYADTLSGKVLVSQTKVDESMEKLGGKTAPFFASALDFLSDVVDNIGMDHVPQYNEAVLSMGSAMDEAARTSRIDAATMKVDYSGVATAAETETARIAAAFRTLPGKMSAAMTAGREGWQKAWQAYKDILNNTMTTAEQETKLHGILVSKKLRAGMDSSNPEVKAGAMFMAKTASDALYTLRADAGKFSNQAGQNFADHLHDKGPAAYTAGKYLGNKAEAGLKAGWGTPDLGFIVKGGGGKAQVLAAGGRYKAGEPRIVGEKGPEFDIPDHSGMIVPNHKIGSGGSGLAAGGEYHFHFGNVYGGPSGIDELADLISGRLRLQGSTRH
jgi:hypothetical protein